MPVPSHHGHHNSNIPSRTISPAFPHSWWRCSLFTRLLIALQEQCVHDSPDAGCALQTATMGTSIHLPSVPTLLFWLSLQYSLTATQNSVGSFFTAIYLNGAPVAVDQTSCSGMGQPQYCCGSGQLCAWDDAGKVACCASGYNCYGRAYSSNAGAAGQYYTSSSSTWNQGGQTTTVYKTANQNCDCESSTALNVVPIVPVTEATVVSTYVPKTTSYYNPTTLTYYPTTSTYAPYTTTTTAVAGQEAEVTSSGTCLSGYKTIVEANVGTPTRIVNCYVLINEGGKRTWGQDGGVKVLLGAMSCFAFVIRML